MNNSHRFLAGFTTAVIAMAAIGCKPSHPNQGLLDQIIAGQQTRVDGFKVFQLPVEEKPYDSNYNASLSRIMAALGNDLGFRVEVETIKKGWFSVIKRYTLVDMPKAQIQGVTIQPLEKVGFEITPVVTERIVIDNAVDVAKGFETWEKEGGQNALEASDSKTKDAAKARMADRAEGFLKNVAIVQKDLGAKRAWWVSYRKKVDGNIPKESPFWRFSDAVIEANRLPESVLPSIFIFTHGGWAKKHGEVEVKDTLNNFVVIAFEGQDGKLIKTEGFKTFIPR